jgi:hypothetical protein
MSLNLPAAEQIVLTFSLKDQPLFNAAMLFLMLAADEVLETSLIVQTLSYRIWSGGTNMERPIRTPSEVLNTGNQGRQSTTGGTSKHRGAT